MDFFKGLFGMTGGKRKTHRSHGKRGGACESGEACAAQFSADSSLTQGQDFASRTAAYHGGKRSKRSKRHGKRRGMRGGAADLSIAFDVSPAEMSQRAGTAVLDQAIADLSKFAPQAGGSRRQRGGAAGLGEAFQAPSAEMNQQAGTSVLDTAFAQLGKFIPNHNGGRRTRRRGGYQAPLDAPNMLLRSEDYRAAMLSPQWMQENLVNPNFNAPSAKVGGFFFGRRKTSRKATRKMLRRRKASRKAKKSHKCPRGKTYRKTFLRKGRRIFGKCVKK